MPGEPPRSLRDQANRSVISGSPLPLVVVVVVVVGEQGMGQLWQLLRPGYTE